MALAPACSRMRTVWVTLTALPCVDVDDQRQVDHTPDGHHMIGYLAQVHEPKVRQAKVHIGESSPSQIDRLKAQISNNPRRERIWRAR